MKRGQVTIFIVLGLVVLLIVGVFYFTKIKVAEVPAEEITISKIAAEFQPVRDYVTSCVEQTAKEGLRLVGEQGGYIYPEDYGVFYNPGQPTEGEGVEFSSVVPYWYYLSSPNDCIGRCRFDTKAVFVDDESGEPSIEGQLSRYVEDNLRDCTAGFENLAGFEVEERGDVKARTVIGEYDVNVYVEYPIRVRAFERSEDVDDYLTKLQVSIKQIVNLSHEITQAQSDYCFLERNTLELIEVFSGLDKALIPPITDLDFSATGKYWLKRDVQDKVEEILQNHMPLMKALNTRNFNIVTVPDTMELSATINRIYSNMILPIDGRNFEIDFYYFTLWPMYLNVNNAEFIKPESTYVPIFNFGVQRYNSVYDISYPVLIEINDPTAFNNEGYTFRFALEANIRDNKCLESEYQPLEIDAQRDKSLLCEPNQRHSGNITVVVLDDASEPVRDAVVSFSSGESCVIGTTDSDGVMTEQFPIGYGSVSVMHPDYLGMSKRLNTELDEGGRVIFVVKKRHTVTVDVMKKVVRRQPGWQFVDYPIPLNYVDEAYIQFTLIPQPGEENFETMLSFDGSMSEYELELVPGTYEITGGMNYNKEVIIPATTVKAGGFLKKKKIPIAEQRLESLMTGTMLMDKTAGYWFVERPGLENSNKITFYMLTFEPTDILNIFDLDMVDNLDQFARVNRKQLEPEIK